MQVMRVVVQVFGQLVHLFENVNVILTQITVVVEVQNPVKVELNFSIPKLVYF